MTQSRKNIPVLAEILFLIKKLLQKGTNLALSRLMKSTSVIIVKAVLTENYALNLSTDVQFRETNIG